MSYPKGKAYDPPPLSPPRAYPRHPGPRRRRTRLAHPPLRRAASDSALLTLLQHRAVLFGLLAAALVLAAFRPDIRWPALIAVTVSMASFLVIAASRGELSGSLRSIVVADVAGLLIALFAAILLLRS